MEILIKYIVIAVATFLCLLAISKFPNLYWMGILAINFTTVVINVITLAKS